MNMISTSNRRGFLRGSTLAAAGLVAGAAGWLPATAGAAGCAGDPQLASLVAAYGRVVAEHEDRRGEAVRDGSRTRFLPVSRVRVEVRDFEAFLGSFDRLTGLSERVLVRGNEASLVRNGRLVVLDNRVV